MITVMLTSMVVVGPQPLRRSAVPARPEHHRDRSKAHPGRGRRRGGARHHAGRAPGQSVSDAPLHRHGNALLHAHDRELLGRDHLLRHLPSNGCPAHLQQRAVGSTGGSRDRLDGEHACGRASGSGRWMRWSSSRRWPARAPGSTAPSSRTQGPLLNNSLTINGYSGQDGDIYTNGNVTCNNAATVHGSIYTQGTVPCQQRVPRDRRRLRQGKPDDQQRIEHRPRRDLVAGQHLAGEHQHGRPRRHRQGHQHRRHGHRPAPLEPDGHPRPADRHHADPQLERGGVDERGLHRGRRGHELHPGPRPTSRR